MHGEGLTWRILVVKVAISLCGTHCLDVAFWSHLHCLEAHLILNVDRTGLY